MLLTGCVGNFEPYVPSVPTPSDSPVDSPVESPVDSPVDSPVEEPDDTPSNVALLGEPPADKTWISPGKVNVGNFYPGARAEYPITIHNGKDTATKFSVTYRYPDHVGEDYLKPTPEVQNWVIIADSTPVLIPKETRGILVVLAMPEDAISPGQKWEFWVSVMDTTQTGIIKTELCTRWLVDMR